MTTLPEDNAKQRLKNWFSERARDIVVAPLFHRIGRVEEVVGLAMVSHGPPARIGEVCHVDTSDGRNQVIAQIIGFRGNRVLMMPLGTIEGIQPGCRVVATGRQLSIAVGEALLGRVVDGFGQALDGLGAIASEEWRPVHANAPRPMARGRVTEALDLGVRAIDGLFTCGRGQRLGIFAGSGVGKSVLLGMIARNSSADVNVIALVGERGREVRDFVEEQLGNARKRSVVVVATSDEPALVRLQAGFAATAIAEAFRDNGAHVMLVMDSITRLARAQMEVGLAAGELPANRGYPPSVFGVIPALLERAGPATHGSITGIYTVLVEGDDMLEPIADTVRSTLDGHIVLSRALAEKGCYPAIDISASVSRLMGQITTPEHMEAASTLRHLWRSYAEIEDLVTVGAYQAGGDSWLDAAVALHPELRGYLQQPMDEYVSGTDARGTLAELCRRAEALAERKRVSNAR